MERFALKYYNWPWDVLAGKSEGMKQWKTYLSNGRKERIGAYEGARGIKQTAYHYWKSVRKIHSPNKTLVGKKIFKHQWELISTKK